MNLPVGVPLLSTEGLRVQVQKRVLVDQLGLQVRPGEFWCLLGPNGAGKTLLLHTLAGARPPAAGQVCIGGRPLAAWPLNELACWRGVMPQQLHDAFGAPVLDVVLQGRHPHLSRWSWEGEEDRALALATLLVQDPPLALMDEPLAHLDLAHQLAMAELMAAEVHERGRAVLMSVHDLSLAQRVGTHALLMGAGQVLAGPIDDVMREDTLSRVFGHTLKRHEAAGRVWWLPV